MIDNFQELSELINSGIALIPVIAKDKKPYAEYKGKPALSLPDLIRAIQYYDQNSVECTCVAIRCGEISGGLICIDVDSKHNEGFSERIYSEIQNLYPDIFSKLEIDRTPSGGLHFYYRIGFGGSEIKSCDLASRYCTEEELFVRPDLKKKCFLELKANGSLCQCYPSSGYTKVKRGNGDVDLLGLDVLNIQFLTESEHSDLIALCGLHNQVVKEVPIKYNKSRDSIYKDGMTPFDEFNSSDRGFNILSEFGWRFYKSSGVYDKWVKPGRATNQIGASFNREKRTFAIYTTNSNLDVDCYNPSSLLCKEKFGGDWLKFGQYLVSEGYGKLKPKIEESEVKKAIKNGIDELPANFSLEAKEQFKIGKENRKKDNPYGEFWTESVAQSGDIKYSISREGIYKVSKELGFRSYKDKPVLIDGNLVKIVDDRFYFDKLKEYIKQPENQDLLDEYEDFLQKSGKFTISRLELLDVSIILTSSKYVSYKFYRNCYVKVEKDVIEVLSYDDLKFFIWEHDKKDRNFHLLEVDEVRKGLYWDFVKNAIGWSEYLMKCIGYYAHDYRDEEGYMMITTEKSENEKDGGRCGKNIFWKLFSLISTFKSTAASMIKKDNQLLQSWNGERVFCLSDMPKNFDLIFFKDMITDGAVIRKLYKDEFVVSVHDMAKLGGSSNYTFDDSDPGVKGRLRLVEFTKYYKDLGGVKAATGKMFPKDWNNEDYLYFDNIMMYCIQEFLFGNCIIEEVKISDTGWNRKFEGMYYHLYSFIKDNIDNWVKTGKVTNADFNRSYIAFKIESNINKSMTSYTINKALTDYCEHFKIPFVFSYRKKNGEMSDGITWTENQTTIRGRFFGDEARKYIERNGIVYEDGELVKEELPF